MSRVLVFVEGQTELTFVREIVAPHLGQFGLTIHSTMAGKPGSGGVPPFSRLLSEVVALLRKDSNIICTTMFDFYGMPFNWPQRNNAASVSSHQEKALLVENAVAEAVYQEMGSSFNRNRFIPYVQMHEFEALLFSDTQILSDTIQLRSANVLNEIVEAFEHPELINDRPDSAPSKQLIQIQPGYQKILHGNLAAKRIGLKQMRQKCPHFNAWIDQLEQIRANE
ncbi:MAG: DUF4276 family protein [Bacteroidetes bacterium]|nr:DUF4276 family protein [Bacteroidota bacterium]